MRTLTKLTSIFTDGLDQECLKFKLKEKTIFLENIKYLRKQKSI